MTGRKFSITYGGRRRLSCIIKGTVLMIEGDTMKDMIHYIAMLPAIAIAISIVISIIIFIYNNFHSIFLF